MEIYANGNKLDITLENEKNVGDLFKSFEQECENNDATTVGIVVDGKNITAEEFDSVSMQELSSQLTELSAKLQSGKDRESNVLISALAAFLDKFCHTVTVSSLFPEKFGTMKINGASIKEFFSDFSQVLNDFEQAIEVKDTILMGDLAEYEISPRLSSISEAIKEI